MSQWIMYAVLVLFAAAGIALYHFNAAPVQVVLWSGAGAQLPLALVIIVAFLAGAAAAGLLAVLLKLRMAIERHRFSRHMESEKNHQRLIADARSEQALGSFEAARSLFSKVIAENPEDVSARVQLAQCYRSDGLLREALTVLEQARVAQKKNAELLLLAAEINQQLGNHTAAHDNAAMLLTVLPDNRRALEHAAASASRLQRYDAAIDYTRRLLRQTRGAGQTKIQERLASLEVEQAKKSYKQDRPKLKAALEEILSRHRDFAPAIAESAALEAEEGNLETAAKLWLKAYSERPDVCYLQEMAVRWLKADNPERALKSVAAALASKAAVGTDAAAAKVFHIELLLQLEMPEQARRELDELKAALAGDARLERSWSVLQSRVLAKEGFPKEAFDILLRTVEKEEQQSDFNHGTGAALVQRLAPPKTENVVNVEILGEVTPPLLLSQ